MMGQAQSQHEERQRQWWYCQQFQMVIPFVLLLNSIHAVANLEDARNVASYPRLHRHHHLYFNNYRENQLYRYCCDEFKGEVQVPVPSVDYGSNRRRILLSPSFRGGACGGKKNYDDTKDVAAADHNAGSTEFIGDGDLDDEDIDKYIEFLLAYADDQVTESDNPFFGNEAGEEEEGENTTNNEIDGKKKLKVEEDNNDVISIIRKSIEQNTLLPLDDEGQSSLISDEKQLDVMVETLVASIDKEETEEQQNLQQKQLRSREDEAERRAGGKIEMNGSQESEKDEDYEIVAEYRKDNLSITPSLLPEENIEDYEQAPEEIISASLSMRKEIPSIDNEDEESQSVDEFIASDDSTEDVIKAIESSDGTSDHDPPLILVEKEDIVSLLVENEEAESIVESKKVDDTKIEQDAEELEGSKNAFYLGSSAVKDTPVQIEEEIALGMTSTVEITKNNRSEIHDLTTGSAATTATATKRDSFFSIFIESLRWKCFRAHDNEITETTTFEMTDGTINETTTSSDSSSFELNDDTINEATASDESPVTRSVLGDLDVPIKNDMDYAKIVKVEIESERNKVTINESKSGQVMAAQIIKEYPAPLKKSTETVDASLGTHKNYFQGLLEAMNVFWSKRYKADCGKMESLNNTPERDFTKIYEKYFANQHKYNLDDKNDDDSKAFIRPWSIVAKYLNRKLPECTAIEEESKEIESEIASSNGSVKRNVNDTHSIKIQNTFDDEHNETIKEIGQSINCTENSTSVDNFVHESFFARLLGRGKNSPKIASSDFYCLGIKGIQCNLPDIVVNLDDDIAGSDATMETEIPNSVELSSDLNPSGVTDSSSEPSISFTEETQNPMIENVTEIPCLENDKIESRNYNKSNSVTVDSSDKEEFLGNEVGFDIEHPFHKFNNLAENEYTESINDEPKEQSIKSGLKFDVTEKADDSFDATKPVTTSDTIAVMNADVSDLNENTIGQKVVEESEDDSATELSENDDIPSGEEEDNEKMEEEKHIEKHDGLGLYNDNNSKIESEIKVDEGVVDDDDELDGLKQMTSEVDVEKNSVRNELVGDESKSDYAVAELSEEHDSSEEDEESTYYYNSGMFNNEKPTTCIQSFDDGSEERADVGINFMNHINDDVSGIPETISDVSEELYDEKNKSLDSDECSIENENFLWTFMLNNGLKQWIMIAFVISEWINLYIIDPILASIVWIIKRRRQMMLKNDYSSPKWLNARGGYQIDEEKDEKFKQKDTTGKVSSQFKSTSDQSNDITGISHSKQVSSVEGREDNDLIAEERPSRLPIRQRVRPNFIFRFLLDFGLVGHIIIMELVLAVEWFRVYTPMLPKFLSWIFYDVLRSRKTSLNNNGVNVYGRTGGLINLDDDSRVGKKTKRQKKKEDQKALDNLRNIGDANQAKYTFVTQAFMKRHSIGPYGNLKSRNDVAVQAKGNSNGSHEQEIKPKGESSWILDALTQEIDESDIQVSDSFPVETDIGVSLGSDDAKLSVGMGVSVGKKPRRRKKKQSQLRSAALEFDFSDITSSVQTSVRPRVSDRESGVMGRLKNSYMGRSILGAYPGDLPPPQEAADSSGLINLAQRYGYGDWSSEETEVLDSDHSEDGFDEELEAGFDGGSILNDQIKKKSRIRMTRSTVSSTRKRKRRKRRTHQQNSDVGFDFDFSETSQVHSSTQSKTSTERTENPHVYDSSSTVSRRRKGESSRGRLQCRFPSPPMARIRNVKKSSSSSNVNGSNLEIFSTSATKSAKTRLVKPAMSLLEKKEKKDEKN